MISVYGLFKPSLALELSIGNLKEAGFAGENMLAVALDSYMPLKQKIMDSMYSADGRSLLDGMAIFATIGMVFGVIYGSVVYIGSVALGLVGMVAGAGLGYLLDSSIDRGKKNSKKEK